MNLYLIFVNYVKYELNLKIQALKQQFDYTCKVCIFNKYMHI